MRNYDSAGPPAAQDAPSAPAVGDLVAALIPVGSRVRTDVCWCREPGEEPKLMKHVKLGDAQLRQHVGGAGPVYGAAPILPGESTARIALFDLDSHDGETDWQGMVDAARRIIDVAEMVGLAPIPFRSTGGRGIHLYFVWDAPQDARSVRQALRDVLAGVGLKVGAGGVSRGEVEVFPKQARVESTRFGNMFVLPLARASVPLLGPELVLGTKADAVGLAWPMSEPVPVVAPPAPRDPQADVPADLAVLASALDALPNDDVDYDTWRNVVFSVHAATGGSEDGRELARVWSAKSSKHVDEVFDAKVWDWATGASGSKERIVTEEYVFRLAQQAGWMDPRIAREFDNLDEEDREERRRAQAERDRAYAADPDAVAVDTKGRALTADELLADYVLVAEGTRVAPRAAPHLVLPLREFKAKHAASVDIVPGPRGKREVHRVDAWLKRPDRITVHAQTFAPGRPEFTYTPAGGESAQNLWLPRPLRPGHIEAPDDWRIRAQPFFDHIDYLVPDTAIRSRFVQWLAHIEQRPGELPHTHYLQVAHATGIGRNWLANVLWHVHKGYVALGFKLGDSLKSGFNGSLSRTVLAVVDELHEAGTGHDAQRMGEELKSMLTETTRTINPKYGRQHVEFNCTRFLMFSNHDAALPLAENDRRVIVIENPTKPREPSYYRALYALLDDPLFIASVARALAEVDISTFDPGERAPMTAAKRAVITAGRSDVVQALADVATAWPSACITAADLKSEVSEITGISVDKLGRIAAHAGLAGLRAYPGTVLIGKKNTRIWLLRDVGAWSDAPRELVREEVERGRELAARPTDDRGAEEHADELA